MEKDSRWTFNNGYRDDGITTKCSKKIGDVSTTFEGYGKARLRYKICNEGSVKVSLERDGVPEEWKSEDTLDATTGIHTVDFDFNPYSQLKIEEEGVAMVHIISLELGCKGTKYYIS